MQVLVSCSWRNLNSPSCRDKERVFCCFLWWGGSGSILMDYKRVVLHVFSSAWPFQNTWETWNIQNPSHLLTSGLAVLQFSMIQGPQKLYHVISLLDSWWVGLGVWNLRNALNSHIFCKGIPRFRSKDSESPTQDTKVSVGSLGEINTNEKQYNEIQRVIQFISSACNHYFGDDGWCQLMLLNSSLIHGSRWALTCRCDHVQNLEVKQDAVAFNKTPWRVV